MIRNHHLYLLLVLILSSACRRENNKEVYKDASAPIENRVQDLLSRMSLEEKVAQTQCIWQQKSMILDDSGRFDIEKTKMELPYGIGQIARPSEKKGPAEMARFTNEIQKYFVEQTRLGIPVIFHEECLHGHAAPGGTSFPQPIALASTFNDDLVHTIFNVVAKETRVRGGHQALTPVVDVARDPRWGRVEETYGEDPYLCSVMGLAAVKGFQGDGNTIDKDHVAATLKHFAVHSQPESGINCAPGNYSERLIRETFFPPFKKCVQEGKVMSIMASYNEIDGIPSHANQWLLNQVLRKEWGFNGFIVSDYYAIKELAELHHLVTDRKEAALLAMKTGVDLETPDLECYFNLLNLVKEGRLETSVLDTAVARVLRAKFKLGLFDNPYTDPAEAEKIVGNDQNRALALKSAQESIILLKNENNTLPLDKSKLKKVAVVGPNADKCILGGYSDEPFVKITPFQAIKEKLGPSVQVIYSEGCKITEEGGSWYTDKVTLPKPEEDQKRIKEAETAVQGADVILLFIGGNEETSREAWSKTHMGDRVNLNLIGAQNDLVKAMVKTGKPVVVVLNNGSPLIFNEINNTVPAILECWYLGQETGYAVADVLFGDYNPGGKLPITLPRSEGQIPAYYNYKPSARRGYIFDTTDPLYPFGFGLSYTSFSIENIVLSKNKIKKSESVKVSVDVVNTGKYRGDEVVQLYIRDEVSSITRPIKELKGFRRINLEPGQKTTVEFNLGPEELGFYDLNMNFIVEPGTFKVMAGSNSVDLISAVLEVNN
ncbi:MAG: glycoside hydrolase family 3 N-terminal domain-containing protein [Cytophagaceae bacterium]